MSLQQLDGTFTELSTLNTALNTLVTTDVATSDANATITPTVRLSCDMIATGATTGTVDFYLIESTDGTNYSIPNELGNLLFVGSVEMNGTTAVKNDKLQFTDRANNWKLHAVNNSGATLGVCTVSMRTRTVDNGGT